MNSIFKKYHFLLLISILLISIASCRKGGEPTPNFNEVEVVSNEGVTPTIKGKGGDKGGNSAGDVVGGDDNEDDDGGVLGDDDDLGSSGSNVKAG